MPSKPERNERVRRGLCIARIIDRTTGERRYCRRSAARGSVYCPAHADYVPGRDTDASKDSSAPSSRSAQMGASGDWRPRAWWAIAFGIASWVIPIFIRAAIATSNPDVCVRWFYLESLALAIPGAVLAVQVLRRTSKPRPALALAAIVIGWIGVVSPIGQWGARLNDPCFAETVRVSAVGAHTVDPLSLGNVPRVR